MRRLRAQPQRVAQLLARSCSSSGAPPTENKTASASSSEELKWHDVAPGDVETLLTSEEHAICEFKKLMSGEIHQQQLKQAADAAEDEDKKKATKGPRKWRCEGIQQVNPIDVHTAYDAWSSSNRQASSADFVNGAAQAYHALGVTVEKQVLQKKDPKVLWSTKSNIISHKFTQEHLQAFQAHFSSEEQATKRDINPSNPLQIAAANDLVVEADLVGFAVQFPPATPPAADVEEDADAPPEKEYPGRAVVFDATNTSSQLLLRVEEHFARWNRSNMLGEKKPKPVAVARVELTVVLPPRRVAERFQFFFKRIENCEDAVVRANLAKMMALSAVYPLVFCIDAFSRLFTGETAKIAYVPALYDSLFQGPDVVPVTRKEVMFSLDPEKNTWLIDRVSILGEDMSYRNATVHF